MPVLVNNQGLAEHLDQAQADAALKSGSHFIPLVGENGPESASLEDAQKLIAQGYKQPSPEELHGMLSHAKHSSTAEQAMTFAEGVGRGATFGASTGIQIAAGANPENIAAREEINPIAATTGELTGFAGSALVPGGAANLATKAGTAVSKGIASRIGANAAKQAAEMALFSGGDEISKAFLKDPQQSTESIVTNIGLSAALGGGMGAAFGAGEKILAPIWEATKGKQLSKTLTALKDRAQGVTADVELDGILKTAGMEATPAMKATLGSEVGANITQNLTESATRSGNAARKEVEGFYTQAADESAAAIGRTDKDIAKLTSMSEYEEGVLARNSLDQELHAIADPVKKAYEPVEELFRTIKTPSKRVLPEPSKEFLKAEKDLAALEPELATAREQLSLDRANSGLVKSDQLRQSERHLSDLEAQTSELQATRERLKPTLPPLEELAPGSISLPEYFKSEVGERLNAMGIKEGHFSVPDGEGARALQKIQKGLEGITDLEGLRRFQSGVREELAGKGLFALNRQVGTILRDAEERGIETALTGNAPEMLQLHRAARQQYRQVMEKFDSLADRLPIGKYYGPESFIKAVNELSPEVLIKRLSGLKDVELQKILQTSFPNVAAKVKDYHLDQLLKKAAGSAKAMDGKLDPKVLFKQVEALSPEMRDFLLSTDQQAKLNAVKNLVDRLPDRLNPSGTARALDAKFGSSDGAWGLMGSLLTGGSLWGAVAGVVAKQLGREVPDAIKFSVLKILGSGQGPVDAVAFKSMVNMVDQAYKAANLTKRVVNNVLKPTGSMLIKPSSPRQLAQLDDQIKAAQQSPDTAMESIASISSYLPDHAIAAGTMTANAVNYLSKLRPPSSAVNPLDKDYGPDPVAQARYDRALQIAEQPLLALESVKDGSLVPQDVITIATLYPSLYKSLQNNLIEQIANRKDKDEPIPYKSIVSMGMFLQMPLESSTLPYNIMANQQVGNPLSTAQQASVGQPGANQGGLKSLSKGIKSELTPSQARSSSRSTRN